MMQSRWGKRHVVALAWLASASFGATGSARIEKDLDVLAQVRALYGLVNDDEAIARLAAEENANDLYRQVSEGNIDGYAGAWFDGHLMKLVVGSSTSKGMAQSAELGAASLRQNFSLAELEAASEAVEALHLPKGVFQSLHIDFRENTVKLAVIPGHGKAVEQRLLKYKDRVKVDELVVSIVLSTDLRGADGTKNGDFGPTHIGCSVGASHESGFYSASHCGYLLDPIYSQSGTFLGTVTNSHYSYETNTTTTVAGVTPKPQINGYSAGVFSVPGKWAGISQSAVGTTVCRYGKSSGGPHCGTVDALNYNDPDFIAPTRVAGACTNLGDSGGSFVSASGGQIQGTVIGGSSVGTCPTPTSYLYFAPIRHHLALYSSRVLTSHGAAAPIATGVQCPVASLSGLGTWYCRFTDWSSQGVATFSWSAGTPYPSGGAGLQVRGNCSGGTVNVSLTVTNGYGSSVTPRSFPCPLGPVP